MSAWLVACLALLPALTACILGALRGAPGARLVAYQLACAVATLLLALMTFAFDQPSSMDLALCLALLGLPGAVLFASYMERAL